MKSVLVSLIVLCLIQIILAFPYLSEKEINMKRGVEEKADWNSLGWAWGKRSAPLNIELPRRALRSAHPIKKNPEWEDLGWSWGRK